MTGGPRLSAMASGGRRCAGRRGEDGLSWAAVGPRKGDEANEAGESEGLRRTLADGLRKLGWA